MFIHASPQLQRPRALAATGSTVREHNLGILLRMIWDASSVTPGPAGPGVDGISRADLARRSGLSRSTVSEITANLLGCGLIAEGSTTRSTGGRPSIKLQFRDKPFVIIGVDLGGSHVACVRADMHGTVTHRREEACPVRDNPEGALKLAYELVDEALDYSSCIQPVAIGVAVPSPLDRSVPGQLSFRILPAWKGIDLGARLFERYRLPVLVDNDANLGALAEAWWGAGRGVQHFTYLKLGTGIGAGHIIGGDIFRGASGIAGEIGHSTVDPGGRLCRCGQPGCLEAVVGARAIAEQARERLAEGAHSSLRGHEVDLDAVIDAARAGDPLATAILTNAAEHLGIAIANLVNLLNPARVILGGRLASASDLLLRPLRHTLRERTLAAHTGDSEIRISELGPWSVALGAVTLVIQWALRNPRILEAKHDDLPARASTRLLAADG